MEGLKALGMARRLIDDAKRDGRFPAGIIEIQRPQDRRDGERHFTLVFGDQLQHEAYKANRFLGFIDERSTDEQVAAMLLEVA